MMSKDSGIKREIQLLQYKEYGIEDAPSLSTLFSNERYENQDRIADYLKKGRITVISPQYDMDAFTGDTILPPQTTCLRTDGKYSWSGDLSYYVEKYNARLPKEVEDWILSHYEEIMS